MPTPIDGSTRELLLLLAGSALFAASGVVLGATPAVARVWHNLALGLAARPAISRVSAVFGLASLVAAGVLLVSTSPVPSSTGETPAVLIASLFAAGVFGLVIGQSGQSVRPSSGLARATDTVGPTSATIASLHAEHPDTASKSRAA